MNIQDYSDSNVRQKSMDLVVEIYRLVKKLPEEETHVLSEQSSMAAVSVATNIAEGQIDAARGATAKVETLLLIAIRLGYFTEADAEIALNLCAEVAKMTGTLPATD